MTPTLTPAAVLLMILGMLEPGLSPHTAPDGATDPQAAGVYSGGDLDGDGVDDARDACPGTPAGYPVTPDGCAVDSDGDGVADGADRCTATKPSRRGIEEAVDAEGCSVRDRKKERDFPYSLGLG